MSAASGSACFCEIAEQKAEALATRASFADSRSGLLGLIGADLFIAGAGLALLLIVGLILLGLRLCAVGFDLCAVRLDL